jgi:hypothetical protein
MVGAILVLATDVRGKLPLQRVAVDLDIAKCAHEVQWMFLLGGSAGCDK